MTESVERDSAQVHIDANEFVHRWSNKRGTERSLTDPFWYDLLTTVFKVRDITRYMRPNYAVKSGEIDVYLKPVGTVIEMKAPGKSLDKKYHQSFGEDQTPLEQALRYVSDLQIRGEYAKWIITSNFKEIRIYKRCDESTLFPDFQQLPISITLDNLPDTWKTLAYCLDEGSLNSQTEKDVSQDAANIMDMLYESLKLHYIDPETQKTKDDLAVLLTRLVFCMYAEDAALFGVKLFEHYVQQYNGPTLRQALIELFRVLNTPREQRDPYLQPPLKDFPYVNGGLFEAEIDIPNFDDTMYNQLYIKAICQFDWKLISPPIFGSLFEGVLNPETRRAGGMVYTSPTNIHKVIDPLFLDKLQGEFRAAGESVPELIKLQEKLGALIFFDPACGSGNFLTETYKELRNLENEIMARIAIHAPERISDLEAKVTTDQFYGLEMNEFAVAVAHTALWIAEHQCNVATERTIGRRVKTLPLENIDQIIKANALRYDWQELLPPENCNYIMGNPPFVGARNQTSEQKSEIMELFADAKNSGDIDYVAGWYMKAVGYMAGTDIECAFVSTNSITQGVQVANIWKPLTDKGIHINFAHRTFRWDSEASDKAHVFCVIVGFSYREREHKELFHYQTPDSPAEKTTSKIINAYLLDAPMAFIYRRSTPVCDVPKIGIGSQPIDDGNYLFKDDEKEEYLKNEPGAGRFFHRWMGSEEFINGKVRWCLWLGDSTRQDLAHLPQTKARIEAVKAFRLKSKRKQTLDAAERPTHFATEILPEGYSVLIPEVSSERRKYIPMGFIGPETFCSNLVRLLPNATLYHFGILTSQFHNAWMRVVAGRLESRYRYSADLVYNNFIWPDADEAMKQDIETKAQAILDTRAKYPDLTLADLYDPNYMPDDLRKTHKALDKAVERAYRVRFNSNEEKIVEHLFTLYAEATGPLEHRVYR